MSLFVGVPWPRPSQRNIHSLQSGSRHQSASHLRDTRETRESHAARDSGLLSGYDTSTTGTARSSRGSSTSSTDSLTSWSSNTHSQHSHHEKHQDTGQVRHSLAGMSCAYLNHLFVHVPMLCEVNVNFVILYHNNEG